MIKIPKTMLELSVIDPTTLNEIVEFIKLEYKSEPDIENNTIEWIRDYEALCLDRAISTRRKDMLEKMIKIGLDPNSSFEDTDPIENSCYKGREDFLEILLNAGGNPNPKDPGSFPILKAISSGSIKSIELLIKAGADLSVVHDHPDFIDYPLLSAIETGDLIKVKMIAEKGVNIYEPCSSLITACRKGNINIVKYLIGVGADFNRDDGFGNTPVGIAAYYGHVDILEFLFSLGANIEEFQYKNNEISLKVIDFLIKKGLKL